MAGDEKITFSAGNKFDLQLSAALVAERRLAQIFTTARIERVELKTESWQWERTGNICIEYRWNGRPSGIAVTQADYWVHELCRDGVTLGYFMFPVERLKAICREAIKHGRSRQGVGDGGLSDVVILSIEELLQ